METSTPFPIPNRLNVVLSLLVFGGCCGLLILGSHVSGIAFVLVAVAFAALFLTNYALLHEASHDNLHSSPRMNYRLGVMAGLLFPLPFTLIHLTHQGHHLRNRTDYEMFDLYYPSDNKFIRRVQWYGTLCGTFWMVIVLANFILAVYPGVLFSKPFLRARSSSYIVLDIKRENLARVRMEIFLWFLFLAVLHLTFGLDWKSVALLYLCAGINWSTRQYVGHAFTRRDVIEGAKNLRTGRLLSWVLLRGEWDLNHHRRPDVPWIYLPFLGEGEERRASYLGQYLKLWGGPRPTSEPAPESLLTLPLLVHG